MVDLRIYNQIAFSKVNFGKYHWYKKDKYFFIRIQNKSLWLEKFKKFEKYTLYYNDIKF